MAAGRKALRQNMQYQGYCNQATNSEPIGRIDVSQMCAKEFYESFVKTRTPVVLMNAEQCPWWPQHLSAARLRELSGNEWVRVERRDARGQFGTQDAQDREAMRLSQFLDLVEGRKCNEIATASSSATTTQQHDRGAAHYLSTQSLEEDCDGATASVAAPFLRNVLRCQPEMLRPSLVPTLVPYQFNLWCGGSATQASSGLHHDFHDNIYCLLRGAKEFRLFSPKQAPKLPTRGFRENEREWSCLPNGLLCYMTGIREDGAPKLFAAEWKLEKLRRQFYEFKKRGEKVSKQLREDLFLAEREVERLNEEDEEYELENISSSALKPKDDDNSYSDLPNHFCLQSTSSASEPHGKYASVRLSSGEALYLPASWFHEVLSTGLEEESGSAFGSEGSDRSVHSQLSRSHCAFNFWFYPPSARGGSFETPYEDDFWLERYERNLKSDGLDATAIARFQKQSVEKYMDCSSLRPSAMEKTGPLDNISPCKDYMVSSNSNGCIPKPAVASCAPRGFLRKRSALGYVECYGAGAIRNLLKRRKIQEHRRQQIFQE